MSEAILILVLCGFALILAELFLPGMIAGIIGAFLLIAAVVLSVGQYGFIAGGWLALGLAVGGTIIFLLWVRMFPTSYMGRKLTNTAIINPPQPSPALDGIVGEQGVAETPLRPSGIARIRDRRMDVLSDSDWIEAGASVVVLRVDDGRVVVGRKRV